MKCKAHCTEHPRHIYEIGEGASTAQRGNSPAQAFNQRFLNNPVIRPPYRVALVNLSTGAQWLSPYSTMGQFDSTSPIGFIQSANVEQCTLHEASSLAEILQQRKLSALFQPLLDLDKGEFLGYEGLIRGPADNSLHSPANLFHAAAQQGLSLELEMLCRQIILESFVRLNLPGHLFLNVSPETLLHPSFKNGQTLEFMKQIGISPDRVIIEITENRPTHDFAAMRSALLHYRSMGFKIAIDDLGEGFSSLRLWSELRPEFIKIDMHFVQGVDIDPIKRQFLKSIQQIALSCGTRAIAEGVETEAELKTIKEIGISIGQGYFIARPSPTPSLLASSEANCIINETKIASFPKSETFYSTRATAQKLLVYIAPATATTEINRIYERFCADPTLRVIPVVNNGIPAGLIHRSNFLDMFSSPDQLELYGKKSGTICMRPSPLLVDKDMPIEELSHFIAHVDEDQFNLGFVITEQGRYLGVASCQHLVRELATMYIAASRYANPLTLLPGNVPVNQHIGHLLQTQSPFVACYCDLSHFKPYNIVYGYHKGDEMIQLTGRILTWACDPKLDFVGHLGSDKFILLMQSKDWKARLEQAMRSFEQAAALLFSAGHLAANGYEYWDRSNNMVRSPLTSLSIGAVPIQAKQFPSHHEVYAAVTQAKKMAKCTIGNSFFIEQNNVSAVNPEFNDY